MMSYAELEVLRAWANEILAVEKARVMTVEEMNGTISLLHKGGVTDDKPQDWRPVVLLNCTNQLVMHILNARRGHNKYRQKNPVMSQELCRHLQRCLKHEDVARQLTLRDLHLACEQWACDSLRELTEEMEMWKWDNTLDNKWARVAMCSQMLNIPIDMPENTKEERRGTKWAKATRELRRLRHRIEAVGGSKDQWEAGVWHMDKEQWDLLWTGEQAFWKAVPHLMAAGHRTAEALTEPRKLDTGRPYKIPQLMAAKEGESTQIMRILVSRGIGGIDERTRGLTQRVV